MENECSANGLVTNKDNCLNQSNGVINFLLGSNIFTFNLHLPYFLFNRFTDTIQK